MTKSNWGEGRRCYRGLKTNFDNIMNPRPREACCCPLHTPKLLLLFSGPFLLCERIHGNHSVCSNHRCQVQNVNILLKLSSDFCPTSNFFTLAIQVEKAISKQRILVNKHYINHTCEPRPDG